MSNSHREDSGIKKQGWLHEEAALKMIGGDAVNLNRHPKIEGLGLDGGNYPTFDLSSSTEICSVKSHLNHDGGPEVQNYTTDFKKMVGWGKSHDGGLTPLEQDAQRIIECGTRGIPIPQELIGARTDQVVAYLQEQSVMRIPSDHVEAVRSALVADAKQLPGNYFLPDKPTESHIQQLVERVQSTGLSGVETLEQLNEHKQQPSEWASLDLSRTKTVGNQVESTQEAIEKTVQETTDITLEHPLDSIKPEPSESEDYNYGFGY